MARYVITPWRTQSDLLAVRAQLYDISSKNVHNSKATEPDARRQAVNRVMAWKLRGNLPHAVESTALLIDAQLHHSSVSSTNSPFSIRAVYSAAFCRFVTGFCDIGRAREGRLEPSSMLDIARQIDMPAEFVALRHEATHEELPSVRRLVEATQEALSWLWKVYWSRLEEGVNATVGVDEMRDEVRGVLRAFRTGRRETLRSRDRVKAEALVKESCGSCVRLCGNSEAKIEACADVLVKDRLLFPSNRELGAPMQGAFLLWDDLLQLLDVSLRPTFLTTLVQRLLEGLRLSSISNTLAPQSTECEAHYLWLTHLLTTYSEAAILSTEMMKWCCLNPGCWAARLGAFTLESTKESNVDFWETWQGMFQASLLPPSSLKSVDDIEMESGSRQSSPAPARDTANEKRDDSIYSGWMQAALPPTVPIGVVA